MDQESNVEFCQKKWDAAAGAAGAALVPGKELATGEKGERFWWTDSETGQAGGYGRWAGIGLEVEMISTGPPPLL